MLTTGEAPEDLRQIFKQRSRWCTGCFLTPTPTLTLILTLALTLILTLTLTLPLTTGKRHSGARRRLWT